MTNTNKTVSVNINMKVISFVVSIVVLGAGIIASYISMENKVGSHLDNTDVHMKYKDKAVYFVPRTELDVRLESIQSDISEIKEAVVK